MTWNDAMLGPWKNDMGYLYVINELSGLPLALWTVGEAAAEEKIQWTSSPSGEHPCFTSSRLRLVMEHYALVGAPILYMEDDAFFYGVMPVGPFCLVIGPATINTVSDETVQRYSEEHGLTEPVPSVKSDLKTVSRYLKLMHYHFLGTATPQEDIPIRADAMENWRPAGALEEYQLAQSENERGHKIGADFEQKIMQAISNGDVELAKSLMGGPTPDYKDIGEMFAETSKESEYLTVSMIALITRAAVAGGASMEVAYELGDVYLKRIGEAVVRGESISTFTYEAVVRFAEMVWASKEAKSAVSYVDACKEYIENNLRKDIQVGDIAPAIGLSRTYLSRLFKQTEGITVQQYIQREKCRHAALMLTHSDYPISQIAQYFGFSSQSYFGSCFQQWYKMTPNAYRRAHSGDTGY